MNAVLPWNHITGLTSNAVQTMGVVQYRLNGPYDPQVAAGGSQPAGWDRFATLYNRCRVVRAHWKLIFSDPSGSNHYVAFRLMNPNTTGTSGLDYDAFAGLPMTKIQHLSTAGRREVTFSGSVVPSEVLGQPKQIQEVDPEYASSSGISSVPTRQAYLDVCVYNSSGTATSCTVQVHIAYECVFSEPLPQIDA